MVERDEFPLFLNILTEMEQQNWNSGVDIQIAQGPIPYFLDLTPGPE